MIGFLSKCALYLLMLIAFHTGILAAVANAPSSWQARFRSHTNATPVSNLVGKNSQDRFREIDAYRNVDILFIGSSHCYRGFDPRIFERAGYRSFNMGSTSQSPLNSYYLAKAFVPRLRPSLTIIEVYLAPMMEDGLESTLDLIANAPNCSTLLPMAIATRDLRAVNALLVFALGGRRSVDLRSSTPSSPQRQRYIHGGYVERDETASLATRQKYSEMREMTGDLVPMQLAYLCELVELLRSSGSAVTFVSAPVPSYHPARYTRYTSMRDSLRALAHRQQVRLLDFDGQLDLDDYTHFFDDDHLNSAGVAIFNAALIERLRSERLLPRPMPK